MSKSLFNKKKIDGTKYVNVDTGETLSSETGNSITSINMTNKEYGRLQSESFVIIDNNAAMYLRNILSKSDLGYVRFMLEMVNGNYNIIYNYENMKPHTRDTLMKELDLARTAFSGLLTRLYTKGVIYYLDGYKDRKKFKHIMLNPTIGRKTNQIHKECLSYFENLSTKRKRI